MLEIEEQLRQHATWVEGQMQPIDLTSTDVPPVRLTTSSLPSPSGDEIGVLHPQNHRQKPRSGGTRRRVWLAVAAVTVLGLLAGTLATARSRAGARHLDPAAITATGPDSALIPTWVPDGMKLWDVSAAKPGGTYAAPITGPSTSQLFGRGDEAEIGITITPMDPTNTFDARSKTAYPLRGTIASLGDFTPRPINGPVQSPPLVSDGDNSASLTWTERGVEVRAEFKGLSTADAAAFLNGLRLADSTTAAAGYVAPDGSALTSLSAPHVSRYSGRGLEATYYYSPSTDSRDGLAVTTCPEAAGVCDYVHRLDFADVWFNGVHNADGSASEFVLRDSADQTYIQAWPDGGMVIVRAFTGHLDLDAAKRIAASVELTDTAALMARQAEISARLVAQPLTAAVDLPSGHLELHRTGSRSDALCFNAPREPTTCEVLLRPSNDSAQRGIVSRIVDGQWIVGASGATEGDVAFQSNVGTPLASETRSVTVGGQTYRFGLVRVPDGVAGLSVTVGHTSIGIAGRPDL